MFPGKMIPFSETSFAARASPVIAAG